MSKKHIRKNIHPLAIHLGVAASNEWSVPAALSQANIAQKKLETMVKGIQMYQQSDYIVKRPETEMIWQQEGVTLSCLKGAEHKKNQETILLVPSLINKAYILNLTHNCSMLKYFTENGFNTYMLSWKEFDAQHSQTTTEMLVSEQLLPAIEYLYQHNNARINTLGYCMGGTLLQANSDKIEALVNKTVLLAAPWDFHHSKFNLTKRVRTWAPSILPLIKERGILPSNWIQALFATIDPKGSGEKFIRFSQMNQNSEQAKLFIAVEDWLNDPVNIPGPVAQSCIEKWFIENMLIRRANHTNKILIMASHKDKLVPYESAIVARGSNTDVIAAKTGHIGLIAGKKAQADVWYPILKWLK